MLKEMSALFALAGILFLSGCATAPRQKWVMYGCSVQDAASTETAVSFLRQAKTIGVTHIQFNERSLARLDEVTPEYRANAQKLQETAHELGITLVPSLFYIGYSGRYLSRDPNLAAGIPVKDAVFVMKDGVALPDPSSAPAVANPDFEEARDDRFAGWTVQEYPGVHSFVDTTVKHSGNSSLKITALDKLPKAANESCRIRQVIKVEPFKNYLLTVWTKTEGIEAEKEDYLLLISGGGSRRHCYQNFQTESTQDWTLQIVTFNSLEATEIELSLGASLAKAGTIWFDDLKVKPAGLLQLVRTECKPLTVTNADRSVTYEEGKDFEPVIGGRSMAMGGHRHGPHPATSAEPVMPGITLTKDSRIKDGDKLLVSFYHTAVIYDSQSVCSVEDPKILEIMEDQAKRVAEIWPTGAYFMNYDEIRVGGWELQPGGAHLKPGELLAGHVSKAVGFIRKYSPGATVYAWSDMFDPTHNARPFARRNGYYYLCNGNWDGAWKGLPTDVVIMNWNGTENAAESLRWFASIGHKQVIAGYYDGDPKESIGMWMKAATGVPNVQGMMYTTWKHNYDRMPEFFKLLDEYPNWVK